MGERAGLRVRARAARSEDRIHTTKGAQELPEYRAGRGASFKMSLALPTSYPSPTSLSCQKCSVFFPSTSLSSSSILIPSLTYKFFIYSWAPPRRSIVEWVGAPDSCARAGLRGTLGPKRGQGRSWRAGSTGPGRPLPMCHPKCHLWKMGLCRSSRAEPVAVISSAEPQNMPGLGWGPYDNTIV